MEKSLDEVRFSPFRKIADGAILTVQNEEGHNGMTVSFGSFGVLFFRPVFTVYVREERYTHRFLTAGARGTLSFFTPEYREALTYFGRHSGRDVDKAACAGLTEALGKYGVSYKEASETYYGRLILSEDFTEHALLLPELARYYDKESYHTEAVFEILRAERRESSDEKQNILL